MRTKIGFLGLVVVGLVIGSVAASGMVRADATTTPVVPVKHHHHHHHIHGKILSVDSTSITIKVHHHHKKGSTASTSPTPDERTFKIEGKTKVESVSETGVKSSISAGDLKPGEHVSIAEGKEHKDVAREITVGHHHHHHHKKPVAT